MSIQSAIYLQSAKSAVKRHSLTLHQTSKPRLSWQPAGAIEQSPGRTANSNGPVSLADTRPVSPAATRLVNPAATRPVSPAADADHTSKSGQDFSAIRGLKDNAL